MDERRGGSAQEGLTPCGVGPELEREGVRLASLGATEETLIPDTGLEEGRETVSPSWRRKPASRRGLAGEREGS